MHGPQCAARRSTDARYSETPCYTQDSIRHRSQILYTGREPEIPLASPTTELVPRPWRAIGGGGGESESSRSGRNTLAVTLARSVAINDATEAASVADVANPAAAAAARLGFQDWFRRQFDEVELQVRRARDASDDRCFRRPCRSRWLLHCVSPWSRATPWPLNGGMCRAVHTRRALIQRIHQNENSRDRRGWEEPSFGSAAVNTGGFAARRFNGER